MRAPQIPFNFRISQSRCHAETLVAGRWFAGGQLQLEQEAFELECSYTLLFEPAEEGGYVAFCPALPGLVTEGDTYEEARARVKEAIEGYLESLQKDGQPIPADKKLTLEPVKEEIRIAIPEPV